MSPLDVLEAPVPPMTAKPWPMLFSKNSCPMKGGTTSSGVCCDEMVPSPQVKYMGSFPNNVENVLNIIIEVPV